MRTEIYGKNITLRRLQQSFTTKVFEAAFESRGSEFTRWMPWCHENYAVEETEKFVRESIENRENKKEFNFAIFDFETFCGLVSLNRFDELNKIFNLGYWIRISSQNRGIASEAAYLLAKTAFEDFTELNRIEIVAATENIPSRKVAEKAGAKFEGILRKRLKIGERIHDAALFSYVREDFSRLFHL